MTVTILHGDCRDVLPTLPADSFDCAFCDPPYGETSLEWDRWPSGWLDEVERVLKPNGSMWLCGSFRMFLQRADELKGWKFIQDVIWEKHNGTNPQNDRFRRVHEIVAQFTKETAWGEIYKLPQFTSDATARTVRRKARPPQWGNIGAASYKSHDGGPRLMRSVLPIRSEHGRAIHPTQKPVPLVEVLLRYSCPPGGSIIDPFSGSGTTGIVAREIGCNATLIELNPAYRDMGAARIRDDAPLFAEVS